MSIDEDYVDMDRVYDEMKDECCMCDSKEEATRILKRYGDCCKRFLKGWLDDTQTNSSNNEECVVVKQQ